MPEPNDDFLNPSQTISELKARVSHYMAEKDRLQAQVNQLRNEKKALQDGLANIYFQHRIRILEELVSLKAIKGSPAESLLSKELEQLRAQELTRIQSESNS